MVRSNPVFIGVDVGTQGVRVVALDSQGEKRAAHSAGFSQVSREEQSPREWWDRLVACLQAVSADLRQEGCLNRVQALSVTSTSGTMIPLGHDFEPIHPAIMYSDPRSAEEAALCAEAAKSSGVNGYSAFNSSSGLPKILWFVRRYPREAERMIRLWAHASDYLIGKLSGRWGVTDYTNTLKTGYDLLGEHWPDYITGTLGLSREWLPQVVPPGTVLGPLTEQAAAETGLPSGVLVAAGMTDGCASQLASGAIRPGDWNTTIGTTLVLKGVTRSYLHDPEGRVYNHKHPDGYWMPGGASNTGGDWVSRDYKAEALGSLNRLAEELTPTPWIAYPLLQNGERFPFVSAAARGFDAPGLTPEERFVSRMEGVAYLERLSYDLLESLSGEKVSRVYTAGGASNSRIWLQIRSSVLGMPILKMKHTEGAAGAAILASSKAYYSTVEEAGQQMLLADEVVEPGTPADRDRYSENYQRFVAALKDRGYMA